MTDERAVTDKPHRSDEPNLRSGAICSEFAGRSRPAFWLFFGPGSEFTWKLDKYETERRVFRICTPSEPITNDLRSGRPQIKEEEHTTSTSTRAKSPPALQTDRVGEPQVYCPRLCSTWTAWRPSTMRAKPSSTTVTIVITPLSELQSSSRESAHFGGGKPRAQRKNKDIQGTYARTEKHGHRKNPVLCHIDVSIGDSPRLLCKNVPKRR